MGDPRNLTDEPKGKTNEQIFDTLENSRTPLEIAIENLEHDFNIGSTRSVNVGVAAGIAMYEYIRQTVL